MLPTITLPCVVVLLVVEKWELVVCSTAVGVYPIVMSTNGCQFHTCMYAKDACPLVVAGW